MYYLVFSRSRNSDGNYENNMHYMGITKSDAIDKFNERAENAFSISASQETLYFTGFNSDLKFLNEIKKLEIKDVTSSHIITIMQNVALATCVNTLTVSGYKPKLILEHDCSHCEESNVNVQKNAYGEYLCADCWVDYLTTDKGLVEYYIGIANGTYSKDSFSTDDLADIAASWSNNTNELKESNTEEWLTYIEAQYKEAVKAK